MDGPRPPARWDSTMGYPGEGPPTRGRAYNGRRQGGVTRTGLKQNPQDVLRAGEKIGWLLPGGPKGDAADPDNHEAPGTGPARKMGSKQCVAHLDHRVVRCLGKANDYCSWCEAEIKQGKQAYHCLDCNMLLHPICRGMGATPPPRGQKGGSPSDDTPLDTGATGSQDDTQTDRGHSEARI